MPQCDNLQKLAIRMDTTTQFVIRMAYVAELSLTKLELVVRSIQTYQRAASEGVDGFAELGLDAIHFANLRREDQFLELTKALLGVDKASDRTRLSMDVMGRNGAEMLNVMIVGPERLHQMWQEADKLGITPARSAGMHSFRNISHRDRYPNVR